jgi:excisionase family DNA binding protein
METADLEVLTLEEAAAYLRVCPRTLRLKVNEGIIPGAKIGRVWRFHKQQLEQWIVDASIKQAS